jgi:hypothetical protein
MVHDADSAYGYLVVLGGLDSTFCKMDLRILYEDDIPESQEWEKLSEPTHLELLTGEKAGITILDHRQDIHLLEGQIAQERKHA